MIKKLNKVLFYLRALISDENKRAKLFAKQLGMNIGENVRFTGMPSFGSEPYLITIGNDVTIASGVIFHNHDGGVGVLRKKYPGIDIIKTITVGNNVFIGSNATIMPGINIGNNCIVGASSVVTRNIPDNVVVAGIPAKIIKTLEEYEEKALTQAIYIKNRNNLILRKTEILKALNVE